MISATKLKAIMKALPTNLLFECSHLGNLTIRKEKDGFIETMGVIDFKTGELFIGKCLICVANLETTDTEGKRRCPICKNIFPG